MLRKRRAALAVAALAALAACEDPYAPDLAPRGEVRFTYTGAVAGEFVAEGRMNRRNPNAGTWAIGDLQTHQGGEVLGVFSQQRREDNLWNAFFLEWGGARVGSVTCAAGSEEPCPFIAVLLLGTQPTSRVVEARYSRARGTVTVTTLNDRRAAGTFSLTLLEEVSTPEPRSIQVVGSFDVSLQLERP